MILSRRNIFDNIFDARESGNKLRGRSNNFFETYPIMNLEYFIGLS